MNEELEKQFEVMEKYLRPEAEIHKSVINFTKLMKMFYEYIKEKSKETDERKGSF